MTYCWLETSPKSPAWYTTSSGRTTLFQLDIIVRSISTKSANGRQESSKVRCWPKCVSEVNRGGAPRLKTFVIGKGFNQWVSDKKYYSTDACVSCGKCVEVCPLQNISLVNDRPRWNGHCTHCEACYHYCPQNAVQFGKVTRGKGQYYFHES